MMIRIPFFVLLTSAAFLVKVVLASDESVEIEGPCELNCCFDCICCGPGTRWDPLLLQCLADIRGPAPIPFDHGGKCYLADCVGQECCGAGTVLTEDLERDGDACQCIASDLTTSNPASSPTDSPTASPTEEVCEYRRRNVYELTAAEIETLAERMEEYFTPSNLAVHSSDCDHSRSGFLPWHRGYLEEIETWFRGKGYLGANELLPKWDPATPIPAPFRVVDKDCLRDPQATLNVGGTGKSNDCGLGEIPVPDPSNPPDHPTNIVIANTGPFQPDLYDALKEDAVCDFYDKFSDFSRGLQGWHNRIHGAIDGPMSRVRTASNLLIFSLWHAYVDDIYYCFCNSCPCTMLSPGEECTAETIRGWRGCPVPLSELPGGGEANGGGGDDERPGAPVDAPNIIESDDDPRVCLVDLKDLTEDTLPVWYPEVDTSSLLEIIDQTIETFDPRAPKSTISNLEDLKERAQILLQDELGGPFVLDSFDDSVNMCIVLLKN